MSSDTKVATLVVASNKDSIPNILHKFIIEICVAAIEARGVFTIALSGGSLPSFLSSLHESFLADDVNPKYSCWHIILADERCVPNDDPDNNLSSIRMNFLANVPIPDSQIYGIDESKLNETTEVIACLYEESIRSVLALSGGHLDLALLGFGPDGHTCSLFPGHPLLEEKVKLVASIDNSPKPPPRRITLTLPVLNTLTRNVIFCGAGESKSSVIKETFSTISFVNNESNAVVYRATLVRPAPFPSGMVFPNTSTTTTTTIVEGQLDTNTLTWIVDVDSMKGITCTIPSFPKSSI